MSSPESKEDKEDDDPLKIKVNPFADNKHVANIIKGTQVAATFLSREVEATETEGRIKTYDVDMYRGSDRDVVRVSIRVDTSSNSLYSATVAWFIGLLEGIAEDGALRDGIAERFGVTPDQMGGAAFVALQRVSRSKGEMCLPDELLARALWSDVAYPPTICVGSEVMHVSGGVGRYFDGEAKLEKALLLVDGQHDVEAAIVRVGQRFSAALTGRSVALIRAEPSVKLALEQRIRATKGVTMLRFFQDGSERVLIDHSNCCFITSNSPNSIMAVFDEALVFRPSIKHICNVDVKTLRDIYVACVPRNTADVRTLVVTADALLPRGAMRDAAAVLYVLHSMSRAGRVVTMGADRNYAPIARSRYERALLATINAATSAEARRRYYGDGVERIPVLGIGFVEFPQASAVKVCKLAFTLSTLFRCIYSSGYVPRSVTGLSSQKSVSGFKRGLESKLDDDGFWGEIQELSLAYRLP